MVLGLLAARFGHLTFKPPIAHPEQFAASGGSAYPPALHASGNRLTTPDGKAIMLRGLMIVEPARLDGSGRLHRELLAEIQRAGANAVRMPVHPEYWVQDPDYLWRYLDPLVRWYDDTWEPAMFRAGGKEPTRWGAFVLEQLKLRQ